MQLDSVQIGVKDLAAASCDYAVLFGCAVPLPAGEAVRFAFARGAVELETALPEGVHAMRFVPEAASRSPAWPAQPAAFHGLDVRTGPRPEPAPADGGIVGIDHVVINTNDRERARALWRDRLGLRLALERDFPARGVGMLFFRSAGVTLEFVSPLAPPPGDPGPDRFFGLAYRVVDIDGCRARLAAAGVEVSGIRAGNKPGTRVATVRSHTAGVPTLLIQQFEGAEGR
ncbi:VOC family protein [Candidatus Binatia bacterium]|nr:VOC family protein [Candidatus Binatia bacterium]